MTRTTKTFYFALLFFGFASSAWAWNSQGHMVVADLAWAQLAAMPLVRAAIATILKRGKNQFQPTADTPDAIRDSFDFVATFPDVIKRDLSTNYEPVVKPMNETFWPNHKPDLKAGAEAYRCKSWHYYDTPIRFKGAKPAVWRSNLLVSYPEAVKRLRELQQNRYAGPTFPGITEDDLRFWWLSWILHLAGDAHQPLHCCADHKYVVTGDNGGNLFPLPGGELHAVWDNLLVNAATADSFHISDVERLATPSTKLAPLSTSWLARINSGDATDLNVKHWVAAGARAAKNITYKDIVPNEALSPAYLAQARDYARSAGVLAGRRLANTLTGILQ